MFGAATLLAAGSAESEQRRVNAPEPGQPKKALILAPYEFQEALQAAPLAARARLIRDYRKEPGEVTFHADLVDGEPNAATSAVRSLDGRPLVTGQVQFEDFLNWNDYNLVIVNSHGSDRPCLRLPPVGGDSPRRIFSRAALAGTDKCPLIWAGRSKQESYGDYLGVEIIAFIVSVAQPHPGLTRNETADCTARERQREREREEARDGSGGQSPPGLRTPGGKPCRVHVDENRGDFLLLWTAFFDTQYRQGLDHTILVLLVCYSGASNALLDILAPRGNKGVVVIAFDGVVMSNDAIYLGEKLLERIDEGDTSRKFVEHLNGLDREWHMVGRALGPGDEPIPEEPAAIISAETNATYGRDIVLLVDPVTGEELLDGASVRVDGVPDDGEADRLWLYPEVIGVRDPERPGDFPLQVGELDTSLPGERYVADRLVDEGTYRYELPVALGRDHQEGERVDLEVRVDLPGGGESRWVYENIALVSTCGFTAHISNGQFAGRHQGLAWRLGPSILLADSNSPWEAFLTPGPGRVGEGTFENAELSVLAVRMETPDAPGGVGIWHTTPEAPDTDATMTITSVNDDRRTGWVVGSASGHLGWRADYDRYEYLDVEIEFHAVPFSVGRSTPFQQCRAFWEPDGQTR